MSGTIDIAKYVAPIDIDMTGFNDGFDKADAGIRGKLNNLSGVMKGALVGGIVAIGAGIVATIGSGIQKTAELEEHLSKFKATTGATTEEVEEIRKISQDLYKTNTDSMEDIVATGTALKQAMGLTTEEIKGSQQAFMDYAKTTGQANTDVVGAVDDMGDAWGLSLEEMVGSLDMFKLSSEKFGTDVAGIQSAMQGLAPASKALGMNFEETNGLLNMMAESGLDASAGVTALNFAAKTVKSPEEFKKMMEDIQSIKDPTERTQAAIELFGARAGVSMANVLDGSTSLDEFMVTMAEAEGTVASASSAFDGNFNVQLELAKKMISGLVQELGERFMPVINTALTWVTDNMPKITEVVSSVFTVAGDVIGVFVDVINWLVENISKFVEDNQASFQAVADTISTIFNGVMEFINGFIELFKTVWTKYGEDILAFITTNLNNVKGVFDGVLNVITGLVQAFTALLSGDWDKFGKALGTIITGAFKIIQGLFKTYTDYMGGILRGAISVFSGIAKNIMDGIFNAFKSVWDTITRWVSTSFTSLSSTISGFGSKLYNAGKDIFNDLLDGLKYVWKSISDFVSDKVEWIADKLSFWKKSEKEMDSSSSSKSTSKPYSTKYSYDSYDVGTNYVPNDQLAYIHQGEAIIPKEFNPYAGGKGLGGSNTFNSQYDITLQVDGNMDKSILPTVQKMIERGITKAQDRYIMELNKVGITRPVKYRPL